MNTPRNQVPDQESVSNKPAVPVSPAVTPHKGDGYSDFYYLRLVFPLLSFRNQTLLIVL